MWIENKLTIALVASAAVAALALLAVATGGTHSDSASFSSPPRQTSAWEYSTRTDGMRGTVEQVARARSIAPAAIGGREYQVWLEVTTADSKAVRIVTGAMGYCSERTFVTLRIDDQPLETASCQQYVSTPADTYWLVPFLEVGNHRQTAPFPARLANARSLTMELPTFDGAVQVVFDVSGLSPSVIIPEKEAARREREEHNRQGPYAGPTDIVPGPPPPPFVSAPQAVELDTSLASPDAAEVLDGKPQG